LAKQNPTFSLRGQKRFKKVPPLEDAGNRLPGTAEINSAISMFNETGNVIAAYEACCLCEEHDRAWPEPLTEFVINSVFKPLVEAGRAGKNVNVTNIVLNLRFHDGGKSVFQNYHQWHKHQKAMRRCDDEMLKTRFARRRDSKPPTKTSVYKKIAKETGYTYENLKRLHEQWDKSQASFSIGAQDRAHAKISKGELVEEME
jgi:hypothetical protein